MRVAHTALICGTVLLCSFAFWPGLYRYGDFGSSGSAIPMRTNRLTGRTELFNGTGWQTMDVRPSPALVDLPPSALRQVTGTADFHDHDNAYLTFYNGSQYSISEMVIRVAQDFRNNPFLKELGDTLSVLTYRRSVDIEPLSSGNDYFMLGVKVDPAVTTWRIISAKGTPHK